MKTRKKEKHIAEKILTKVMESGILLNGNAHFAVHEAKGRINCIDIYNGLFSPESEIGCVQLNVNPRSYWDEEDNEHPIDLKMHLFRKSGGRVCSVYLQKEKSKVLREFLDYIDENTYSRKTYKNSYIILHKGGDSNERFGDDDATDLATSPSFKRLVEYIEENKHLILHNDKEFGKSHALTDADFI